MLATPPSTPSDGAASGTRQPIPADTDGRFSVHRNGALDVEEFLQRQVYPALFGHLDTAFPEFGFRQHGTHWIATEEATRDLPGSPRPDRVYCYEDRPWGLLIQGGGFVRFIDLMNGGTKPTGRNFIEVIDKLAELAGISVPNREISPQEAALCAKREVRRSALETVSHFCHEELLSERGADAFAYLKGRGFSEEAIRDLQLGFYPSCAAVKRVLHKAGFTPDTVKEIGLLRPDFEGRVIYTWADATGQPATLYADWPERPLPTGVAKKLVTLAGGRTKASPLYFDRARAGRERDLVLVEGVTDAALLQSFGETRVVACVGAQLSGEQVKTLLRYRVGSVTICLDPDGAGDRGTLACIRSLQDAGIHAFVAPRLPDGLDPDEFLLRHGADAWREHIRRADHAFRFQARSIIDRHRGESWTDRGLANCLDEAISFAAGVIDAERSSDLELFFWEEILRATGADKDAVSVRREALREKMANEEQRRDYKNLVASFQRLEGGDFFNAKQYLHREVDRLRATEWRSRVDPVRNVAEELDDHDAYLQRWRGQEFIGLPQRTLRTLDENTRGLRGLILLAAAPNVGKTTLAVQLGVDAVVHNPDAAFLFLSLEMPRREMITRIKSRLSGLNWETLVFGSAPVNRRLHDGAYFTPQELNDLAKADVTLRDIGQRIRILDNKNFPEPTLERVLWQINDLKARTGVTRVFVLVDYLQVWPVPDISGKIRTDIDADKWRIDQMKALQEANEFDPVLVISEARKPSEKDSTWGGGMADVMGSARSTYRPDVVLLLRTFSDEELGSTVASDKNEVKQKAAEERAAHARLGYALQRLSIVKGRDGTIRGNIDLQFFFRRSTICGRSWFWQFQSHIAGFWP